MLNYFGYGSNLNFASLKAKGVTPSESFLGKLYGYQLTFNVEHWFNHEGGMGNVVATGNKDAIVEGIVHVCTTDDLKALDTMEAYGDGYDRIEVEVETARGRISAITYVGMSGIIDDRLLPTRRYLNIITSGAEIAGLSTNYIQKLKEHPTHIIQNKEKFIPPSTTEIVLDAQSLKDHINYTALGGFVFDMSGCRSKLRYVSKFFGGKDMTLFHLKRLDTSDGTETIDDFKGGKLSPYAYQYINNYLSEYDKEFTYIGIYQY